MCRVGFDLPRYFQKHGGHAGVVRHISNSAQLLCAISHPFKNSVGHPRKNSHSLCNVPQNTASKLPS